MQNFKPDMTSTELVDRLDFEDVLNRCDVAIIPGKKGKAKALCPFHSDHDPSLHINLNSKTYFCQACKAGGGVLDFIATKKQLTIGEAAKLAKSWVNLPPANVIKFQPTTPPKATYTPNSRDITAIYDYPDYQVVRYEPPNFEKTFRQRRPDGHGGWIWNMEGIRLRLYQESELHEAETVFIVEGEKDVETLKTHGIIATCNTGGAGKWLDEHSPILAGKEVIILQDNDEAGRNHTAQVAASLDGYAAPIKIVELPDLPEKGDITDWLEAGNDIYKLWQLIRAAPEYLPQPESGPDTPAPALDGSESVNPAAEPPRPKLIHFDDLKDLPPPEWLFDNLIHRNSFAMLVGEPGAKKTFIALDFALQLGQTEPVIYIAAEGAGGVSQRIKAWEAHNPHIKNQCYLWPEALQLGEMSSIIKFLGETEPLKPSLIIIDTLARCALGLEENSSTDMGIFVNNCDLIKRQTGACVLVIHHMGKNGATERGSGALKGACDTMLKATVEGDLTKLACEKQKDAPNFEPIFYKFVEIEGSLVPEVTTADNMISGNKVTGNNLKVLAVLAGAIFEDTGANWRRLLEVLEWEATPSKKTQLFSILNALKKKGYITQSVKGEPYLITPAGRDMVSPQSL